MMSLKPQSPANVIYASDVASTYNPSDIEDEDVYFEKSQVHLYLQDTKFTGSYDVYEDRGRRVEARQVALPAKRSRTLLTRFFYKTNEQALSDQVAKILLCGLIADEHHHYLDDLYIGHERAQFLREETICPLKVLIWCSGVVSAAASSVLYCLHKGGTAMHLLPLAMPLVTVACWQARQRQKRLSHAKCTSALIVALETLFLTLRKSVKLVQENEMIAQGHLLARGGVTSKLFSTGSRPPDYATSLQLMPSLRGAIFENTKDAIEVLFQTDEHMASAVPVSNVVVDDNEVKADYEEILTEDRFSLTTLKSLQNVFVSCQSKVMLRLALSLCPLFWLNPQSSQLEGLYNAISLATEKLKRLETNLNLEYHIFYSFGLKPVESQAASVLTAPTCKLIDVYTGVHTAVLRLQAMLFESRAVEKSIETYHCVGNDQQDQSFLEHLENSVSRTAAQVDALLTCFNLALLEVNKLKRRPAPDDPIVVPKFSAEPSGDAVVEQEEYVVEDEVYELFCKKNDGEREHERGHETMDMSNDEKAEKEIGKQSATMVKELKIVLKGKAKEWKMREAVALRKRANPEGAGTIQEEERLRLIEQELQSDAEEETSPSEENDIRPFSVPSFGEEIISTERWVDENAAMKISWAITENSLRFRLPVSQIDEEFCCSGDESEVEDETTQE